MEYVINRRATEYDRTQKLQKKKRTEKKRKERTETVLKYGKKK